MLAQASNRFACPLLVGDGRPRRLFSHPHVKQALNTTVQHLLAVHNLCCNPALQHLVERGLRVGSLEQLVADLALEVVGDGADLLLDARGQPLKRERSLALEVRPVGGVVDPRVLLAGLEHGRPEHVAGDRQRLRRQAEQAGLTRLRQRPRLRRRKLPSTHARQPGLHVADDAEGRAGHSGSRGLVSSKHGVERLPWPEHVPVGPGQQGVGEEVVLVGRELGDDTLVSLGEPLEDGLPDGRPLDRVAATKHLVELAVVDVPLVHDLVYVIDLWSFLRLKQRELGIESVGLEPGPDLRQDLARQALAGHHQRVSHEHEVFRDQVLERGLDRPSSAADGRLGSELRNAPASLHQAARVALGEGPSEGALLHQVFAELVHRLHDRRPGADRQVLAVLLRERLHDISQE